MSDRLAGGTVAFAEGLIGREADLARLRHIVLAEGARVVTLTGPGGVGKTRLAWEFGREAASAFPGGAGFISLVAVDRPERVVGSIARGLGLVDEEARLPERLRERLRDQATLLILDNFEHLLPAAAAVADLVADCPETAIVVTSRQPLRVPGERVVAVEPLSSTATNPAESPAARLFLLRAEQVSGRPMNPSDHDDVAAICARLDGLPLAIELAANWMRATTPAELLPRFTQRLDRLRGGGGDPRHQTMRGAIAWSNDLLTPEEQALFRRVAVFTGGFTLKMAELLVAGRAAGAGYPNADGYAVPYPFTERLGFDPTDAEHDGQDPEFALALAPITIDALDGLRGLVDQHLIRRVDGVDGKARYDMLETIREYGRERLADSCEERAVRHAHAAAMLAFAEATSEGLWHAATRHWDRARVDLELPNLRQALAWLLTRGDPAAELAQRIAGAFWIVWQTRGLIGEGREWMERALALRSGRPWTSSCMLPALGFFCWIQGDDERATAVLDEALRVTAESGLRTYEAAAHFFRALVAWRTGPAAIFEMIDHLERAEAIYLDWRDETGLGIGKLAFGVIARLSGSPDDALVLFEEARELFITGGYEWGLASAHYYAGEALRDLGRREDAVARLREGLRRYWDQGDNWGAGGVISALACLAADDGDDERAARLFGVADALLAKIGAFLPPTDLDAYRAAAAELRARMGETAYDAAHRAGGATPPEELVPEALADPDDSGAAEPVYRLTGRQLAFVLELAKGFDPQTVARRLGRAPSSAYEMVQRIRAEFGLATWEEIVPFARAHGLIPPASSKTRTFEPRS